MSTFIEALHVPLFDRLTGAGREGPAGRVLDAAALQASLQRDLQRLFNARNGLTLSQFLACEGSVIHYGLPDLLSLAPGSETDLATLAQVAEHAIALYEPRLVDARVSARPGPAAGRPVRLAVSARARLDRQLCRVDFELGVDGRTAALVPPVALQPQPEAP